MKTLILVRHAKSSWEYPVDDKDRTLKLRGIKDAHLVSNYIADKIETPEVIYSSIANRALHTCAIFTRTLKYPFDKVIIKEDMYDFGGSGLVETVKSCDDAVKTLMVFGHNHAITAVANTYGSQFFDNVPTSGTVVIQFDINSWNEIDEGKTILKVFPKELK
ncbi:histidine phosphatase family protein [Kordia algicida OT-1]|uniref:Phosphoglycerate mutase family domain protein n=1 Tax=Kordia algicida OT-1 TaxID=391587 RepID=A9E3U7_9FLAO|nr:histidine phosphatase family protein [Kordia algicida]EDP95272.1 phosphoglycerate mutase family domain protein [Kordia algicida OT-1]